jgi:hypothetical protein
MDVVGQDVLTVPLDHLLKCPPSLHRDGFLLYNNLIHIKPMSYEATVEFKFNSTYTPEYKCGFGSTIDDDFIPEEHFVITAPAADLSCRQYFKLFEKFMLAVGMSPDNIRSGAMSLVLNEWVNDTDQRKTCDEYEVTRNEDLHEKFKEWKQRDEEIERLNHPDGIPCVYGTFNEV